MYSVEDLLISHGYKLPRKHSPPPAPRRAPGEGGPPYGYPSRSSSALGSLTSASGSTSNSQRDLAHSHGRSVLVDPGFYDAQRGVYVQPHSGDRGISYWKRRGQDFSALLDYADGRMPMGVQRAEGRAMSARERELALQQWRLAAERRQHGEAGPDRWAQQQQQQHLQQQHPLQPQEQPRRPRTAEGAVPPRTKPKSQSLPRMALPTPPPPGGRSCLSAGPSSLQLHEGGAWMGNSAPQARARQSRPPRPPSYEVHQQTRGNTEGPMSRAPSRQEYCPSEPPGYMPPPSYRRQPIMGGGHGYRELLAGYMYRNDPYQQGLPLSEGVQWYARQAGTSWPDHHGDGRRSAPCRAVFPVYSEDGRGVVQYIPFDDPRVRHISGGLLTDADKIRNIQNEIPGITVSEQSPDDSAFLSPQESVDSADVTPPCHAQWPSYPDNLSSAPDLNRNPSDLNRNPTDLTSDPAGKRHPVSSRQSSSSDQGFSETITQVKKFEPEVDSKKPTRRRQKETMFCLVSVPITPQVSRDDPDQNNNNKAPSPTVMSVVTQPSNQSNPIGQSASIPEPQPTPTSPLDSRMSRRAPLRRELVDAWTLQARCSGSWPGDQYRNQQTQTGSPEITRVHPPSQPAPDAPSSDSTTDSGVGTDCGTPYSLPMKGQRSISPSSTSAFSRTSQPNLPSPSRLRSPPTTPPAPQPSPRRSLLRPAPAGGQEAFGQFLLKPVGRRPWDAIGELESFNKESQKVQEPAAACQNIPEPNHTSGTAPMEPSEHKDEVDKMDISPIIDDWGLSELVPIYRRTRSSPCWSEDQAAGDRFQGEELNGRQENCRLLEPLLSSHSTEPERQDIPVPQESMLRDVGLTVYTPDPLKVAPEESFSALALTADTQPVRELQSNEPLSQDPPRTSEVPTAEKKESPNSDRTHTSVIVRRQRFRFSSEGPAFLTESLSTFSPEEHDEEDEVLEALLSKMKKRPPSEDLSPLYQVQSADGIPQNESIEERAARILGISVPAESLVSAGQSNEEMFDDPSSANQDEALVLAELVSTNQNEVEHKEDPAIAYAEKPDGEEKEEGVDEGEEDGEKEKGELQGKVEEEIEAIAAVGEAAVPGETTEEGQTNVRGEETTLGEWEVAEGESVIAEETAKPEEAVAIRREETAVRGETAVSEEETAEVPVSDDPTGEEEVAAGGGEITEEQVAGSEAEISESALASEETVKTNDGVVEAADGAVEAVADAVEAGDDAVEAGDDAVEASNDAIETVADAVEASDDAVEASDDAIEAVADAVEVSDDAVEASDDAVEAVDDAVEAVDDAVETGDDAVEAVDEAGEAVDEAGEEVDEAGEETPDQEVQQVSRELRELQVAASAEVELMEEASASPDSYMAIATLEVPEILSIVEEEDEDAELGLYRMDRMNRQQVRAEASSYTATYLTLACTERVEEEEKAEEEVREKMEMEEAEEQAEEEEGMKSARGAEEESWIERDREEEENPTEKEEMESKERQLDVAAEEEAYRVHQQRQEDEGRSKSRRVVDEPPYPGVRPTPLPRSTVVKREIRLPLAALEDPDTYTTSDSYDPSRVERV